MTTSCSGPPRLPNSTRSTYDAIHLAAARCRAHRRAASTPDTVAGGEPLSERRVYDDVGNGIVTVWWLPSYTGAAILDDLEAFLATAASVFAERLRAEAASLVRRSWRDQHRAVGPPERHPDGSCLGAGGG